MPPALKRKTADDEVRGSADVVIPVVIGSYARKLPIPEGSDYGQVYEWVVSVRSAEDPLRDLSPWIASVEFTLHSSFLIPKRLISQQPFSVREEGWGEFPVGIKINFAIQGIPSIVVSHQLKLLAPVVNGFTVNERYDQICIATPSGWQPPLGLPPLTMPLDPILSQFMTSFQDYAYLEEIATSELSVELNAYKESVKQLQMQAISLEERYLRLRLDHS